MKEKKGLCYRCEMRAKYLESGIRPRLQCGDIEQASYSCYQYVPVRPVILVKADGKLLIKHYKDGDELYWLLDKAEFSARLKVLFAIITNFINKCGLKIKYLFS